MFYIEKSRIRTRANMKGNIVSSLLCRARLERQASEDTALSLFMSRGPEVEKNEANSGVWPRSCAQAQVQNKGTKPF